MSSHVTIFLFSVTRQESWEDSDLFQSQPTSDVDAMGKKRYVGKQQQAATSSTSGINRTSVLLPVELIELFPPAAPHVVYQTGKKPDEPCSITSSLNYFPEDEPGEVNVTSPPNSPPANLTVVTVEGCPSFIILDWEKPDNHTTGRPAAIRPEGRESVRNRHS